MGGDAVAVAGPVQPLQVADRGGTFPLPAEGGEVVQPHQVSRRGGHRIDIQRARPRRHKARFLGFDAVGGGGQPVGVMPTKCRESSVETRCGTTNVEDTYVLWEKSREATHQRQELRRRFGGLPNLEMPGFVDQFAGTGLSDLLGESWILVNTAEREGLPTSFLEAFAHGCAILSRVNPDNLVAIEYLRQVARQLPPHGEPVTPPDGGG